MLWAHSTTKDCIRAENKLHSTSQLFNPQVSSFLFLNHNFVEIFHTRTRTHTHTLSAGREWMIDHSPKILASEDKSHNQSHHNVTFGSLWRKIIFSAKRDRDLVVRPYSRLISVLFCVWYYTGLDRPARGLRGSVTRQLVSGHYRSPCATGRASCDVQLMIDDLLK